MFYKNTNYRVFVKYIRCVCCMSSVIFVDKCNEGTRTGVLPDTGVSWRASVCCRLVRIDAVFYGKVVLWR